MKIAYYGLTDVGKKRDKNEDSLLVDEELGIFMVADGMGGHLGGEFASQLAVKTVKEVLAKFREDPELTLDASLSKPPDFGDQLRYAISLASRRIFREANRVAKLHGMGTTAVAILVDGDKGYVAHVGDSRAYRVRSSKIEQLTIDHSLVSEQLQAGLITEAEVKHHRLRNIITRSVGFQDEVEVDLVVCDLEEGDSFILCSDGLSNLVSDQEICKRVTQRGRPRDPKVICERLVELANKNGGDDNITIVAVSIAGEAGKG